MKSTSKSNIQNAINKFDVEKDAYNDLTVFVRGPNLEEWGICQSNTSKLFENDIEQSGRLLRSIGRPKWMPPDVYDWVCEDLVVPPWFKYLLNCERHADLAGDFLARSEIDGEDVYYIEFPEVGSLCVNAATLLLKIDRESPMTRTCAGTGDTLVFEIDQLDRDELAKEIGKPPYYCCRNVQKIFESQLIDRESPQIFRQRPFFGDLTEREDWIINVLFKNQNVVFTASKILDKIAKFDCLDESSKLLPSRTVQQDIKGLVEKGILCRSGNPSGVTLSPYGDHLCRKRFKNL